MASKKVTPVVIKKAANPFDKIPRKAGKKGVLKFSDYVPESNHVSLSDLDGSVIYIVKLEKQHSETFGEGYKLTFKDMPGEKESRTAATYSQVLVPVLDEVFRLTHDGKLISLDTPMQAKIVVRGRAVTLE